MRFLYLVTFLISVIVVVLRLKLKETITTIGRTSENIKDVIINTLKSYVQLLRGKWSSKLRKFLITSIFTPIPILFLITTWCCT